MWIYIFETKEAMSVSSIVDAAKGISHLAEVFQVVSWKSIKSGRIAIAKELKGSPSLLTVGINVLMMLELQTEEEIL